MIKSLREYWKLFLKRREEEKRVIKPSGEPPEEMGHKNRPVESPLIRISKESVRIQVGLDFGTSATKIAFSRYGRRRTQIVNFSHGLSFYPQYCLPSVAALKKNGQLVLGAEAARLLMEEPWDLGFRRLKVIIAGNADARFRDRFTEDNFYNYRKKNGYDETITAERISAIYLAYAMYLANNKISALPEYENSSLEFDFNICVPIDHIENEMVKTRFNWIFKWAEAIYKAWLIQGDSLEPINASFQYEVKNDEFNDSRVYAVPEAVAEVASYLVSIRRKEGIHAIIDFGAGTTDISIFNYMNPFGEGKSTWYSTRNIPKGTIEIEKILKEMFIKHDKELKCTCSEVYRQMERLKKICKNKKSSSISCSIWEALKSLRDSEEYLGAWRKAYKHMRKQTAWDRNKVQIFVTGGGVNLPYIAPLFSEPWWTQLEGPYKVDVLPAPDDFDPGIAQAPYERVAVAYGLTIPLPALEEFVLPSQAPDHTLPSLPVLNLDRDEIYAK